MLIVWIILAVLVVGILIWSVATYNSLIGLRTKIEEAFATIDVYLKKRYDLIPNLVETVKGYAAHEQETLAEVTQARANAVNCADINYKIQSEHDFTQALSKLLALSENYPNLKADTQFIQLQTELGAIEGELAQARKYYNAVVNRFNTKIQTIPTNIIANMGKFRQAPFFEIDDTERQNVSVQF